MNDFEVKLKELFPDIYSLYLLGKEKDKGGAGEVHVWSVVQSLLDMATSQVTGSLYIGYSKGKITKIAINKDVLAFKGRLAVDNETDDSL